MEELGQSWRSLREIFRHYEELKRGPFVQSLYGILKDVAVASLQGCYIN